MRNALPRPELLKAARAEIVRDGTSIDLLTASQDTELVLLEARREAGTGVVRKLDRLFVHLCVSGRGQIVMETDVTQFRAEARPGLIGVTPTSSGEGYWPSMQYITFGISTPAIANYFEFVGLAPPTDEDIVGLASETFSDPLIERTLLEMARSPKCLDSLIGYHGAGVILHRIFTRVAGSAEHANGAAIGDVHPLSPREVALIDDFLEANLASKVTVDEMAALLGVSRYHFSRRFSAATNSSPYQYLLDVRMKAAAVYLRQREPELTVTDVALMVGYESTSSFSRTFTSWSGRTPTDWRRRH